MKYFVSLGDRDVEVELQRGPGGRWGASVDGEAIPVDVVSTPTSTSIVVGTRQLDVHVEGEGSTVGFVAGALRGAARVESERTRAAAAGSRAGGASGGAVASPMPGRVVQVLVAVGDAVEAKAPVVVVEAMKMENELVAEAAGVVTAVHVEAGQQCDGGQVLVELGPLG